MSLTLVTGPANAGKAALVLEGLRARAARGEDPWLVVPTAADARHYRRELAEDGAVVGLRSAHFRELLDEMARRAGVVEQPVDEIVRQRLLAALARDGARGSAATLPRVGYARDLARFVAELESQHVTPTALRQAFAAWAGGEHRLRGELAAAPGLYERYQGLLRAIDRSDPELRAARAADALREAPARWGQTPVLFYGFDDLTVPEQDAIETLARVVGAPVTVALSYEPGRVAFAARATAFQTLLPWAEEHIALDPAVQHYAPAARAALSRLERHVFETEGLDVLDPLSPGDSVRLLEGASELAELELIGAEIRALLDGGTAASEIAVVHGAPESIAAPLAETLAQLGVGLHSGSQERFGATALGMGSIALLRCALLDGDELDLLRWLRTPGVVRHSGLVDRFERLLRSAGVANLDAARAVWEREHWPLSAIDRLRACASAGPAVQIECLERELWLTFDRPRAGRAARLGQDELAEAGALARAQEALAGLREAVGLLPASERSVARALGSAAGLLSVLEELRLKPVVAKHDEDAVALLNPLALRARRVKALFLCGLQEGVFPRPPSAPAFLDDEERRGLAERSGLLLRGVEDTLGMERYLLYACVSRPEERLFLSWHTADDDGNPSPRSLFVDDICDVLGEAPRLTRRTAGSGDGSGQVSAERPQAWSEDQRTTFELHDPGLLRELAEEQLWSASSLEAWACCPTRWFVERLLRPGKIEPDSEPQVAGTVIHAVLHSVHEGLRERTGSARLRPELLELALELMRAALSEEYAQVVLAGSPERAAGVRRRLEADLERYLARAAQLESALEPTHLELEFGFPTETGEGLPALELGDGVRVRGRIDRVDVGTAGEAVVYDYKRRLRGSLPGAKWVSERNLQVAVYMRAVRDLLGYEVVGGFYQPVTGDELRARGAIVDDVELASVRTDRYDPDAFADLVEDTLALARDAGGEAPTGRLRACPQRCSFGEWGCRYPTICRGGHGAG